MKNLYFLIVILYFEPLSAQEIIKHEQIAFEFYLNELADTNIKGTLWVELQYFADDIYWFPSCAQNFKIDQFDSVDNNMSGLSKLVLPPNEKRLKIKPLKKGKHPKVYSTTSYSNLQNQIFVNIVEIYKHDGVVYYIEMDSKGEIINWCRGGWIE